MMPPLELLLSAFVFASSVYAQNCSVNSPCPSSLPCCSQYGFCGSDIYCLGGCDPMASYTVNSCKPNPICQNANLTFPDTSKILSNISYWDGNASTYDWVLEQGDILHTTDNGGELVLTLSEANGGTLISSTRYIHYGSLTVTAKPSKWVGVVSAFITMSDVKDEIDWEWPGANTTQAQSNYFWQGLRPPSGTNGKTINGLTDYFNNYHSYTIDWKPDTLTFLIDGSVVQTINAADTVVNGIQQFPNTPSRMQMSIWPAGINSSAEGTIQWAGGMINWNDPDYISSGHFFYRVNSVSITCYDTPTPPPGSNAYVYGANKSANTPTIFYSNGSTIIGAATAVGAPGLVRLGGVAVLVGVMILGGLI